MDQLARLDDGRAYDQGGRGADCERCNQPKHDLRTVGVEESRAKPAAGGLFGGAALPSEGGGGDSAAMLWRHRRRITTRIGAITALLCTWGMSTGADGDYVMLTLAQPSSSPFATVRYEVAVRGRVNTATHRRELPGYGESLHGMGLLTRAEAAAYWKAIEALDLDQLGDAVPKVDSKERTEGLVWEIEWLIDGVERTIRVADAANHPDRRYQRVLTLTQGVVHSLAGELPFRNVFIPEGRLGWLNVVTVPVARLYVDGFDTELETPLYGYEVSAGTHTLKLKTADGMHERTYKVKVDPGGTTLLRVDLR